MTVQEAIYILSPETTAKALSEIEYYGGLNGKNAKMEAVNKACVVACEALGKQMPKKLSYEGDGYDDNGELIYDTAYCPNCEKQFEVYYDDHANYCPNCGQALDWSEEE